MSASHTKQDEIVEINGPPFLEPTPEAFGTCGRCCGGGKEPEYHGKSGRLLGYNSCGNCGGDGKSEMVKNG